MKLSLLCLFFMLTLAAHAQQSPKDTVRTFLDQLYNQGNLDVIDDMLAADYVRNPGGTDSDDLKLSILSFRAAIPDLKAQTEVILEESDFVAARLRLHGTFTAEFVMLDRPPIPPNHREVDFVIHIIFRFNDSGQIVEEWDAFDNLGFLSQIGETQFLANPVAEVMLYPEVVDVGMSEQNREVVGLYFDALNQGNLDFITTSFKSDFVAHNPFGKLDRTGLINDLSRLRAALPDLNVSVQQLITEGNWTAVIYVLNGSFTQPYSLPDGTDVPATGNTITLPIITFFRFEQQGLVAEFFEIYDSFAFLIQLGLLPLGPSGS